MTGRIKRVPFIVSLIVAVPALGTAQPCIYPDRGQSYPQQESDKGQCYGWAVQQTGFDPANPQVAMASPPPPQYYGQPQAPQGGMLRGAAGGAALGAVGGTIGGEAGKGAAIGARVGTLFGGIRRVRYQQNVMAQGRSNYERAFSACMSARGYTVR